MKVKNLILQAIYSIPKLNLTEYCRTNGTTLEELYEAVENDSDENVKYLFFNRYPRKVNEEDLLSGENIIKQILKIKHIKIREISDTYHVSRRWIFRILNKQIKTLLQRGNKKKIDTTLKILLDDEYNISRKAIEGCLTVLAHGKADEIEKIFIVLDEHQISKETIEGCLIVLAQGKADEIEKIFEVLDRYTIEKGEKEEELDLTNWKINEEQENILRYISMNLENGYELSEAIKNVADMLNVDEEVLEEIEKIREQNNEKEIRMGG